jgi:hypothetical protein
MFRLTELGLHHGLLVVGRDGTEREGAVLQRCALLQYGGAAAGVSRRWRASVLGRNTTGFLPGIYADNNRRAWPG